MSQSLPADPLPALVQDADRLHALREMDIRVACEVMRYPLTCPTDPSCDYSVGTNRDGSNARRNFCSIDNAEKPIPHFASEWSAIRLVEDEIERRGLQWKYLVALDRIVNPDTFHELRWYDMPVWNALRASCEDRCKAALAVCGALHDRRTDAND